VLPLTMTINLYMRTVLISRCSCSVIADDVCQLTYQRRMMYY